MRKTREAFHADLLTAVKQMVAGEAARVTHVAPTEAAVARSNAGMSQSDFAGMLGVSLRTFQEWEQGRRTPTGAAQTLLRVAVKFPEVLKSIHAV